MRENTENGDRHTVSDANNISFVFYHQQVRMTYIFVYTMYTVDVWHGTCIYIQFYPVL